MAQIKVFYKPVVIAGVTTPYYYDFVVHTHDSGNEYYARGGPASNGGLSIDSGGGSGSSGGGSSDNGSNVPFGSIVQHRARHARNH